MTYNICILRVEEDAVELELLLPRPLTSDYLRLPLDAALDLGKTLVTSVEAKKAHLEAAGAASDINP